MKTKPAPPDITRDRLLSPADLGARWHYHRESIRRLVREGRLPGIRLGKRLRVALADVEAYEAANRIHAWKGGR